MTPKERAQRIVNTFHGNTLPSWVQRTLLNTIAYQIQAAQAEARQQALAEAAHVARMAASRYEELVDIQVTDTSKETYRLFSGIANRIAVGIGELAKGGNDA